MLSVIILSFNRCDLLRATLREVELQGLLASAEVIVVDNGSTDGSPVMVANEFPRARLIKLQVNSGVAGYNRGAEAASGDILLLLDDDSWPDAAGLRSALTLMQDMPGVGGVALLPRHPRTKESEWRHGNSPQGLWPCMGCGNLVRRAAWEQVGGYEEKFFLYRNDTDLALKLLGAGHDVRFDPAWTVWHDSPAAERKSERWLMDATRNWAWLARRHGKGVWRVLGLLAGIAWAMKHAGLNVKRQWCVSRGGLTGILSPAPALKPACHSNGAGFQRLVKLQVSAIRRRRQKDSGVPGVARRT